ncbi:MAG: hypothetical protein WA628_08395 [Terriglobales bacterium]
MKKMTCLMLLAFVISGCAVLVSASADDAVKPSAADRDAARSAKVTRHALPAKTERGDSFRSAPSLGQRASQASPAASSADSQGLRYPGDLQYHGGAVLESTESHAIYMLPNGVCPVGTCWGNPERFLRDIGDSNFVHVVDQYVGLHSDDRYTVGRRAHVNFTPQSTPFTDNDMLAIVHAVAAKTGQTGYGHMYHVFLPQGTDECFDTTFSVCYSPDNFNTWFFCAYHGSADFSDIGHVIYSVEPYQNVRGCSVRPNTPNGQLVDSTNNVLSHELIEAITDPDGDAWWNSADNGLFGQEIGDECSFVIPQFFDPSNVRLDENRYAIQPEYSNSVHACATGP